MIGYCIHCREIFYYKKSKRQQSCPVCGLTMINKKAINKIKNKRGQTN
jgi:hypothetical protein